MATKIEDFNDECPIHEGEVKNEYNFGRRDASVYVFHGCKCAVFAPADNLQPATLCASYTEAAGMAGLQKAMAATR